MSTTRSDNPTGILEGYSEGPKVNPPSKEERELVGQLTERFREAEGHRRTYDASWEFYKYYLQGYQMIARDQFTGETLRVNTRPEDTKRYLSMENKLRPVARAQVGKLTRIIPTFEASPRTEDQEDLKAAVIKTSYLEYIFEKEKFKVKYKKAQVTNTWCGTAVFELCWDTKGGQKVSWCTTCGYQGVKSDAGKPCPRCSIESEMTAMEENTKREAIAIEVNAATPPPESIPEPAPLLVSVYEGETKIYKLDTREYYPEPGVENPKERRYDFTRRAIPVSAAREFFVDDTIKAESGIVVDKVLNYYGPNGGIRSQTTYLKEHCYVYKYYERPSGKHEQGRVIYMVNDRVRKMTPNFYFELLGRNPFFFNWFERNDGEFWGESFIAQAWHIQRERNRTLTSKREHRELTMRPKMLKPQKTKLGVDEITTTPGEILEYNPFAGKPSYLEIPELPQYVNEDLDRQDGAIREQASVTEEEMGRAAADTSGRYAAISEAQSSESIAPILVENNDEMTELARGVLIIGRKYESANKIWTITGRDRVRSYSFEGIKADDYNDVRIAQIDSLSHNPALRRQEAREYLADGVFTDANTGMPDFQLYMRVAGLKIPGVGPDVSGNEHAYFASLPDRIMAGEQFTPRPWDDARIAVRELAGWLRGTGRTAPETLVQQIGGIWLLYLQMLQATPMDAGIMGTPGIPMMNGQPSPGQGQTGQQGQGQVGMGPGAMPGTQPGPQQTKPGNNANQDAANTIRQADQAGETAARGATKPHEG